MIFLKITIYVNTKREATVKTESMDNPISTLNPEGRHEDSLHSILLLTAVLELIICRNDTCL